MDNFKESQNIDKIDETMLAECLYEGYDLSNLAENLAKEFGKAQALTFFKMMDSDVQFFWQDIARQLIKHSREWETNEGSACVLSKKERERIHAMHVAYDNGELRTVRQLRI